MLNNFTLLDINFFAYKMFVKFNKNQNFFVINYTFKFLNLKYFLRIKIMEKIEECVLSFFSYTINC